MLGASRYDIRVMTKGAHVKGEYKNEPKRIYNGEVASVLPKSSIELSIDTSGLKGEVAYYVHFEGEYKFPLPDVQEGQSATQIHIDGEWVTLYKVDIWKNGPQPHVKAIGVRPER